MASNIDLWVVSVADGPDPDEITESGLVLARSEAEARALYAAVKGGAEGMFSPATVAEWQWTWELEPEHPKRIVGCWAPPDHILAGYGFIPGEDWRRCDGCGLVLHEDRFVLAGVCDECEVDEGDLVSRQDEGADDLGEVDDG